MITVRLIGGLGNQMFQYAAGRSLADKLGVELALDARAFAQYKLHAFGLQKLKVRCRLPEDKDLPRYPFIQQQFLKRLPWMGALFNSYIQPSFAFDKAWDNLRDGVYLDGYFQSEKYFKRIRNELIHDFIPNSALNAQNQNNLKEIGSCDSVMVHLRRGDYLSNPTFMKVHGVCSLEYYRKAIELIKSKRSTFRFFIFSDDLDYARDNLNLGADAFFVDGNGHHPEMDLYLMSKCRHHIIANSTFSWWGAWLAKHSEQIVITPEPWFDDFNDDVSDLLPAEWHKLHK